MKTTELPDVYKQEIIKIKSMLLACDKDIAGRRFIPASIKYEAVHLWKALCNHTSMAGYLISIGFICSHASQASAVKNFKTWIEHYDRGDYRNIEKATGFRTKRPSKPSSSLQVIKDEITALEKRIEALRNLMTCSEAMDELGYRIIKK